MSAMGRKAGEGGFIFLLPLLLQMGFLVAAFYFFWNPVHGLVSKVVPAGAEIAGFPAATVVTALILILGVVMVIKFFWHHALLLLLILIAFVVIYYIVLPALGIVPPGIPGLGTVVAPALAAIAAG